MSYSELFKLNAEDVLKGIYVAVAAAIFGALQQATTAHGYDFASYDWGGVVNIAVTAGIGYLTKNFLSDANGMPLGMRKK